MVPCQIDELLSPPSRRHDPRLKCPKTCDRLGRLRIQTEPLNLVSSPRHLRQHHHPSIHLCPRLDVSMPILGPQEGSNRSSPEEQEIIMSNISSWPRSTLIGGR